MAEGAYAQSEQADIDGIDKALQCLKDATAALNTVRKGEVSERGEEAGEDTPVEKQPKSLKDAAAQGRERFKVAKSDYK